jgi:hypothetical protein
MYEFLSARLLEPSDRVTAYRALLKRHPHYLPALFELARELKHLHDLQVWTIANKEEELETLEDFVTSEKANTFLRYFIDKHFGQQALDEMNAEYELIEKWDAATIKDPVSVSAIVRDDGVEFYFKLEEEATNIWYKLPGARDFLATRERTLEGRRVIDSEAKVGKLRPGKYMILVKYQDANGRVRGPYEREVNVPVQAMQDLEMYLERYWSDPDDIKEQIEGSFSADSERVTFKFNWIDGPSDLSRFSEVHFSFDDGKTERLWVKDGHSLIDADDAWPRLIFKNFAEKKYNLLFRIIFINGKRINISYAFTITKDLSDHEMTGKVTQ